MGKGKGKSIYHIIVGKGESKGNIQTTHIDKPDHRTLPLVEMRFPDTKARVTSITICLHTSGVSSPNETLDQSRAHCTEIKCVFLTQKPGSHQRRVPSLSSKYTDHSWSRAKIAEEPIYRSDPIASVGKCVSLTQKPGSHQRRVPRTEGGNASIVVPSLLSKNFEKLELVCVHGYKNAFLWHKSQGHIKEKYLEQMVGMLLL